MVQRAAKHFLGTDQVVAHVEEEGDETFTFLAREHQLQVVAHGAGGVHDRSFLQLFVDGAPWQFQRRLQLAAFGRPQAVAQALFLWAASNS
jgi:hypothetical protein